MELPEECWKLIFKSIEEDDHRFLESLSLVSTSFLTITNRIRSTFTITDRTVPLLHRHLLRFGNLKRIRFRDIHQDLDSILLRILISGLDFESLDVSGISWFPDLEKLGMMKKMKELICSGVLGLDDNDLVSIGVCFPLLEKLDISYPESSLNHVSDSGIVSLSLNLRKLLKINVSGNHFITDKALVALSRNCVDLREIVFRDCEFISSDGVEFVLRNSRGLESFAFNRFGWRPSEEACSLELSLS